MWRYDAAAEHHYLVAKPGTTCTRTNTSSSTAGVVVLASHADDHDTHKATAAQMAATCCRVGCAVSLCRRCAKLCSACRFYSSCCVDLVKKRGTHHAAPLSAVHLGQPDITCSLDTARDVRTHTAGATTQHTMLCNNGYLLIHACNTAS
jgi:hypothetical protein